MYHSTTITFISSYETMLFYFRREKMGNYARVVQVLQKQLMEVVLEILGLNPNYLQNEIEKGSQVLWQTVTQNVPNQMSR